MSVNLLLAAVSSVPPAGQLTEPAGEMVDETLSVACGVNKEEESLGYLSHGFISVIGRRRTMEDAVTVEIMGIGGGEFGYFAVYDGHGGSAVSNACSLRLHKLVGNEIEASGYGRLDWGEIMRVCFKRIDEEINIEVLGGGGDVVDRDTLVMPEKMMGSTAVVVVVSKEEVMVANCGDSRAVLCRGGVSVALSHDHKPDRPDERERMEAAGGTIINWNGIRVSGVLATSRSIGDQFLKPYVISEPEVTVSKRTDADNFIIIASDGLWDVISNELACEVTKHRLSGRIRKRFAEGTSASEAAALLAELAMAKGSKDNISVIVVELKQSINDS